MIVVAKVGSTSRQQLTEAVESLQSVGADVLGVCLIGVKSETTRYGYGYGASAGRGSSSRRRSRRASTRKPVPPREPEAPAEEEVIDTRTEVTPPQRPSHEDIVIGGDRR